MDLFPLISDEELKSLLVFQVITSDWVREVHMFSSKRKRGKTFILFRNRKNKIISTLEELKEELVDSSFLVNIDFQSGQSHEVVSNRVGAAKIARRRAKEWMNNVQIKKDIPVSEVVEIQNKKSVQSHNGTKDSNRIAQERSKENFAIEDSPKSSQMTTKKSDDPIDRDKLREKRKQ